MKLIFIYGPAASGKLTVARQLSALTGIALFHNHLVVDALLEKFEFGDPNFIRLREAMWMTVFDTAAKSGQSLIFTFAPEPTVEPGFPQRVISIVESRGGKVFFVRLTLSVDEQERRIANESRKEFRKLTSLHVLRSLRADFDACEAAIDPPDLTIDTETTDPAAAAQKIASAFGLSASAREGAGE